MPLPRMSNYPAGAIVQHKDGYKFVKMDSGHWEAEHRWVARNVLGENLGRGDRVYHKDGDRENNRSDNLVKIHFNQTPFRPLPRSIVLHIPARVSDRHVLIQR